MERPAAVAVPDTVTVDVTPGTAVFLTSDLHFASTPTDASRWAEAEVSPALDGIEGPAVLILAGDVLELWAGEAPDAHRAMAAHPGFASAVRRFAGGPGRRVISLPGNHDGRLAWDSEAQAVVTQELGAELAFAVELVATTPDGPKKVRVEHGHRFDPANAFHDPRNPLDTPLGQHIVQEILPELSHTADTGLLEGVESLEDPRTFPSFVTSRIFYRRVVRQLRWLLVPVVFAIGIHFGIVLLDEPARLNLRARDFVVLDMAVVALALVTALVVVFASRRAWRGATLTMAEKRGRGQNDNARAAAQDLLRAGYQGMVSGHTHHPELSALSAGFYANTGSGTKVVERVDARFDLPHVYAARLQLSWVVLQAAESGWTARLVAGHRPVPGTALERLVTEPEEDMPEDPAVVASWPSP